MRGSPLSPSPGTFLPLPGQGCGSSCRPGHAWELLGHPGVSAGGAWAAPGSLLHPCSHRVPPNKVAAHGVMAPSHSSSVEPPRMGFGYPRVIPSEGYPPTPSSQFPSAWRRTGATVRWLWPGPWGHPWHRAWHRDLSPGTPALPPPSPRGSLLLPAGADLFWVRIHARASARGSLERGHESIHPPRSEGCGTSGPGQPSPAGTDVRGVLGAAG